eukprot:gene4652-3352_t
MGKIRTKTVKRASRLVVEKYFAKLNTDFYQNKRVVMDVTIARSKKMKNKIAGYATHIMKRLARGPVRGISLKLQEEERERRLEFVPTVSAMQQAINDGIQVDGKTMQMLNHLEVGVPQHVTNRDAKVAKNAAKNAKPQRRAIRNIQPHSSSLLRRTLLAVSLLFESLTTTTTKDRKSFFGKFLNMGKIRTKTVKRASRLVVEKYFAKLNTDFYQNKRVVMDVTIARSKKMKNKIAGYATHIMKRLARGPVRGISLKLQEEERERRLEFVPTVSAMQQAINDGIQVDGKTMQMLNHLEVGVPQHVMNRDAKVAKNAAKNAKPQRRAIRK